MLAHPVSSASSAAAPCRSRAQRISPPGSAQSRATKSIAATSVGHISSRKSSSPVAQYVVQQADAEVRGEVGLAGTVGHLVAPVRVVPGAVGVLGAAQPLVGGPRALRAAGHVQGHRAFDVVPGIRLSTWEPGVARWAAWTATMESAVLAPIGPQ